MAPLTYLDTHVVAWLFSGRKDLLTAGVRVRIEESDLLISPAVKLELQYLYEIRRITSSAEQVVDSLRQEVGLRLCDLPFLQVIDAALEASWTRDPFDRLIASQATLRGATLLTKDGVLLTHCELASWPA
jgi:PIN domain nuclease of toxin-antitoxin system